MKTVSKRKRLWLGVVSRGLIVAGTFFFPARGMAADAAFDLAGPAVDIKVQRSGRTLPISEVPNLQVGDRLWIHPDLPETQSAHYVMVVAFLRGATNPPPDSWFTRVETWNRAVHEEGVFVTVPEGAQQALVFLAPETGGGFSTLRNAVRGKPGTFVRAAQDLQQASWDRARLEKYLEAVKETPAGDADELHARTALLARSLNIKVEQQCFDKPSAQQVPCLTQNSDQLVLDDAHAESMVSTLTTGTSVDLLAQISSTPTARAGYYSPYIGAVVDTVRLLSTAHTAQYQYIPALALPKQDELNLRLNNPPSFRNPKSVLVVGLPPVAASVAPPLRAVDAKQVACVDRPQLLLAVEGAPLVFATELAHDFQLHVDVKGSEGVDLPAKADPVRGGFVVDTTGVPGMHLDEEVTGTLRGAWGFGVFDGPHFHLRTPRPGQWVVASKDASALIVGREDTLHLQSPDACCVEEVTVRNEQSKIGSGWRVLPSGELEIKVPLQAAAPGWVTLQVKKFGQEGLDEIPLHTYAEAGRLDSFTLHAGDAEGVLRGTRLDEVKSLEEGGVHFEPGNLSRQNQRDELQLSAHSSDSDALKAGEALVARVTLKDGRSMELKTTVDSPRPKVQLISKSVQLDGSSPPPLMRLGNQDELPQDARLNFFLKVQAPEAFASGEKVEVATGDESFRVLLSVADGNLTLQDSRNVLAVLDPLRHLGPSAFGPLKFRAVSATGVEGDWQPLASLVRIPELKEVRCASAEDKQCALSGEKLFLIDSVSADADFTNSVTVPDGFVAATLNVPQPKKKTLYIKLRDDPGPINVAMLPVVAGTP